MAQALHRHSFHFTSSIMSGWHFGATVENNAVLRRVKNFVISPAGQFAIGLVLGAGMHKIYGPLTNKILKAFVKTTAVARDPFKTASMPLKILLTLPVCIIAPTSEERLFRGDLQNALKNKFVSLYTRLGFSNSAALLSAKITAIFFSSFIFGLVHFSNALFFWCNPVLFLPQVIAVTIMGLMLGIAKELSNGLHLPIGMHAGNNILAWFGYYLRG